MSGGSNALKYFEDEYQYALVRAGDPRAAQEHVRILFSGLPGKVSEDPIRNIKYLTVASATLASRAAIDAGMDTERAYNISDLYIWTRCKPWRSQRRSTRICSCFMRKR